MESIINKNNLKGPIPFYPPFLKGEVFLLPLKKGGGEGFNTLFSFSRRDAPIIILKRIRRP
jgi:hypothetical protein